MSFTENLYLKRMIQQLHEENLKLKSFINEALRDPRKETTRPLFGPGPHHGSSDLHPTNPLTVDDADTGSAPHPGEEGAVDDMPINPFPVTPSNTFKPNPFSPFRPHPHFPNPYRGKIGIPDDMPTNAFPVTPIPSNTFKPDPFSKFRPHPHFPNPYRGKIGIPDDMPTNPPPVGGTSTPPVGGTSTPRLDTHGNVIPEDPYLLPHSDIPQNAPKRRYPPQRRSRHGYF